jgi:hypothetical protein
MMDEKDGQILLMQQVVMDTGIQVEIIRILEVLEMEFILLNLI